uniref:SAP domain-containing protein n=1 Tax=Anopheles epiroticus TaxID=199890 RepID=A0A182PH14_9DIPT
MDKERLFLPDEVVDMDPNMTNRLQQHTVVLGEGAQPSTSYSRVSPPKAVIDSSPLQSAMDKNKESLKVKLLVRRSFDQLVQQGIMPPLKTSPAIYEQRRQLERAKTGDLLKAKIKKRPDRVELEQRHILEQCDSHVDPSLAEKRRMLEKALLVDHLNSKISHRPGPLDLIGKNILHVEEPIERMVKEGLVDYASTLDESNVSVATPTTVGEGEDSLSSEGESLHSVSVTLVSQPGVATTTTLLQHPIQLQPLATVAQAAGQPQTVLAAATTQPEYFTLSQPAIPIVVNDGTVLAAIATPVVAATTPIATVATVTSSGAIATIAEIPMEQGSSSIVSSSSSSSSSNSTTTSIITSSSISTPTTTLRPILPTPSANINGDLATVRPTLTMTTIPSDLKLSSSSSISGSGGGKEKLVKKKSKSKSITKAKPIKFHEYKGPPNAHKGSSSSSSSLAGQGGGNGSSDNNYQLIMQQQYLLEYLEEMCKKPTGVSSPSSTREAPTTTTTTTTTITGTTDGEELAGSDQTPIDSPLGPGATSGATTSSMRCKNGNSGSNNTGGSSSALPTSSATMDVAMETLNKLKVSQLKKYCKQYNLAVSGTKSNLIERLKPYIKSIDPSTGVTSTVGANGGLTESELEDNLLAEQQKRIAELQLQLKKSQEELEQFRSLCNNPFVGPTHTDQPMVISASVPIPPPPPPPPAQQPPLATVLVDSPFSIATNDSCEAPCADGGEAISANQTPDHAVADTTVPALEGSFFLDGLTTADSTTVDYGHNITDILPELTSSMASIERSPTHRPTLDKVLGQVQPTISALTMNTDTSEKRNSMSTVSMGMHGSMGPGPGMGTIGNVSNAASSGAVGDMHDLSVSLKSVNFDAVNGGDTGDASMQQDTIMLNDFEDIDLVDFHMHSLDSDGPFPMITNHDPDPSGAGTVPHQPEQPAAPTVHNTFALFSSFGNREDPSSGTGVGFVNQPGVSSSSSQHMHDEVLHDQANQHGYLNNNDLVGGDGSSVMLHLDLMDHNDQQANIASTDPKQLSFGSVHHHHHQQQHHLHTNHLQHHSDSNNNTSYDANRPTMAGSVQFSLQLDQPVASTSASGSSSSSSTSSSPSNCFRGLGTPLSSKHANKPNHHHLNLHQQQQQHQLHQQQQQQQQEQDHLNSLLDQLTPPSANSDSTTTSTLINDAIDSFQDNAMDFESLLTNDAETVLNANNCHRMVLDCAQDKPMFNYLPEPSILDYFSEDCNGHDFELKHLDY